MAISSSERGPFRYRKNRRFYKYELTDSFWIKTNLRPERNLVGKWARLDMDGTLTINSGYPWDGASGPAIDTDSNMNASLVHDALYQLMRVGVLSGTCRKAVDQLYHDVCLLDGMHKARAAWEYYGVRIFGRRAIW